MYELVKTTLISEKTTATAGPVMKTSGAKAVFQAVGSTASGSGSATIAIEGSLDDENWVNIGTITLTLSSSATSDGFSMNAPWESVRANVTAISGTGASVDAYMCAELS